VFPVWYDIAQYRSSEWFGELVDINIAGSRRNRCQPIDGEWHRIAESVSTVGSMERLEKFTAVNDVDGDVHLVRSTSVKSTLCGMAPAEATTREVTCYRCHEFSVGI
jgi:hypothetical protein